MLYIGHGQLETIWQGVSGHIFPGNVFDTGSKYKGKNEDPDNQTTRAEQELRKYFIIDKRHTYIS